MRVAAPAVTPLGLASTAAVASTAAAVAAPSERFLAEAAYFLRWAVDVYDEDEAYYVRGSQQPMSTLYTSMNLSARRRRPKLFEL